MSNYLNNNKLPDWKGYSFHEIPFPVTGLDLNTGNYIASNNFNIPDLDKKDTKAIEAFQDWMDEFKPNWLDNDKSLKQGKGYGNFGDQTKNAWSVFGNEFLGSNPNPDPNTLYNDPMLTNLFENI